MYVCDNAVLRINGKIFLGEAKIEGTECKGSDVVLSLK